MSVKLKPEKSLFENKMVRIISQDKIWVEGTVYIKKDKYDELKDIKIQELEKLKELLLK